MREMPKSITLMRRSAASSMLAGLMSRWTTPRPWAQLSASSNCSMIGNAACGPSPAPFGRASSSGVASTYSMAKNGLPSCDPKS